MRRLLSPRRWMKSGDRGRCLMAVVGEEQSGGGSVLEQWEVEDTGSHSVGEVVCGGGVRKEEEMVGMMMVVVQSGDM